MKGRIILNAAKCKKCNTIIVSEHRHDFQRCKCKAVAVDGGCDYLRRVGEIDNIMNLSVIGPKDKWIE